MTQTIEQKALIERLRQRSSSNYMLMSDPPKPAPDRDCHAAADLLEQLLPIAQEFDGFRQEVSDAVMQAFPNTGLMPDCLGKFIIPAPKTDPLVKVIDAWFNDFRQEVSDAASFRTALEAYGLEIREKNDG